MTKPKIVPDPASDLSDPEIRAFWQSVYVAAISVTAYTAAPELADAAVAELQSRLPSTKKD